MTDCADIVRLEEALDAVLVDRRTVERFVPTWLEAGKRWSHVVWQAADALGPLPTEPFIARPLLLCGAHRSGTTMLRDLLDGHAQLSVLPAEAAYLGARQAELAAISTAAAARELGELWLRRLANPVNQPPFWLLGRSSAEHSPYIDFSRRLIGALGEQPDYATLAPLAAVAQAWSAGSHIAWWVEKTPGTERHLDAVWRTHPDARVIHVVRDPDGVARSYQALIRRAGPGAPPLWRELIDLIRSYRIAARLDRNAPADRYRIVRYDALVADRSQTMGAIAAFLDIAMDDVLLEPMIAGQPAEPNSSHRGAPEPLSAGLADRALLGIARWCYRRIPG